MSRATPHRESHNSHRAAWLRAAVLGANDGIVSTACLVLGVDAAHGTSEAIMVAGVAGLVAGALSMAVGEWVSVGSQKDTEDADIARETHEHATMPDHELDELTEIYEAKGLSRELAHKVALELSAKDALAVHLAEELGISEQTRARPFQAASTSAVSFALGAALPLAVAGLGTASTRAAGIVAVSVVALGALGAAGAALGGAPRGRAAIRVVVGGLVAMALTMGIGSLFGASVG